MPRIARWFNRTCGHFLWDSICWMTFQRMPQWQAGSKRYAMQCNENIDKNLFKVEIGQLLQQSERVQNFRSKIWAMDTFQLQHFLGQLFSETSVEYSFAKFIDLLTVSSSLMSVYSHKKCNVLLICLNRVLSPAITSLEMTTGVEKGLRNLLCSLETYWSLHLANTIWWVYLWGTNKTNLCNCQNQNLTWNRNKWARLFLVCGLDSTCVYGGGRG